MKRILVAFLVAFTTTFSLGAATEIAPSAAFADSAWNGRPADNAISNSGLSDGLHGTDASTMWMGSNSGNTGGASFARWFVVDLGAVRPLGNMKVWNFNMVGYAKRGLKQVDVYVADTDAVFSGTPDFTDTATWTLSKEDLVLSMAPGSADYAGETACNFGGVEARWVGFWIDELFESSDDWAAGGGYGGLSKVKFYEYEAPAEILDPSQFTYRAPVTFPGYTASGALDNFPVLVRLTETVSGFSYDDASADGSDIRFALEDGTVLPSEVALWNPDGESLVWVGVPSLSSDASVWLYWGKTHNFPASQTDGSVWTDAGYFAVWHMDEAVGATTTADSAGGTFDGTHVGTTPGQEGKVGRGVLISNGGWNDPADRGKGITTAAYAGKGNVFTLTSWLKYKSGQNPGTDRLISSKSSHTDTSGWEVSFQRWQPRRIDVRGSGSTTAIENYDLFPGNWMGSWRHLGIVYNGGNVAVFLDGAYKTYGTTEALVDTDRVLVIGANVGFGEDSFKGTIDEMRLRQGRSADAWIAAEYNSVNNASFAAIGAKELLDSEHDVALLGAVSVPTAARHSATISWVLRTASSDASATVTAYYGTDPNALSSSATLASGAAIATGAHESTLSELTCATTWYVKLVATGRDENSESEVVSFKTAGQPVFGLVTGTFDDLSVTLGGSLADAGAVPIDVTAYFGTDTANWTVVGQWTAVDSARAFEATTTAPRLDNYVAGFRASGTCPDCGAALAAESDVISVTVSGECRWTGAAGTYSWNTPGNWSSGTVPGPMDTAVFGVEASVSGATIALDGAQAVKALVVESAGELALGSAADVEAGYGLSAAHLSRTGANAEELSFAVPFSFSEPENGTNTLVAAADVRFGGSLGATASRPLVKSGAGTVTLAGSLSGSHPQIWVREGILAATAGSSLKGPTWVGGGEVPASLTFTRNDIVAGSQQGTLTVLTNGTASIRQTGWSNCYQYLVARDGGVIQCWGGSRALKVTLRGGTVSCGSNERIEATTYWGQGIESEASSLTAYYRAGMLLNNYDAGAAYITIADGEAPVDLVMTGSFAWSGNSSKAIEKRGAGVMKMTATTGASSSSPFRLVGGALLCDNESGSPIGNTELSVGAGTTLGGTGFIGGTERGNVTVAGSASNPATVAPGSVDETTGAHLFGTLTVGTESQTNNVVFGANSKLFVRIGEFGKADSLAVVGTLDLSGDSDALELVLDGRRDRIRGGRYVLASATEGVVGVPATVVAPLRVKISVESNRIVADVPGPCTVIVVK